MVISKAVSDPQGTVLDLQYLQAHVLYSWCQGCHRDLQAVLRGRYFTLRC